MAYIDHAAARALIVERLHDYLAGLSGTPIAHVPPRERPDDVSGPTARLAHTQITYDDRDAASDTHSGTIEGVIEVLVPRVTADGAVMVNDHALEAALGLVERAFADGYHMQDAAGHSVDVMMAAAEPVLDADEDPKLMIGVVRVTARVSRDTGADVGDFFN